MDHVGRREGMLNIEKTKEEERKIYRGVELIWESSHMILLANSLGVGWIVSRFVGQVLPTNHGGMLPIIAIIVDCAPPMAK